jgi:hypothetical protein
MGTREGEIKVASANAPAGEGQMMSARRDNIKNTFANSELDGRQFIRRRQPRIPL